ncbi:MAG: translesion DNA synthesis-associated protein ImuA, partial [Variovorax sp.]
RGERMAALLAAARLRRKLRAQQQGAVAVEAVEAPPAANVVRIDAWKAGGANALDRLAVVA